MSDPTPDTLAMPRFDDDAIDMQELLRRLAERVVNAVMDAEADQLCGGIKIIGITQIKPCRGLDCKEPASPILYISRFTIRTVI